MAESSACSDDVRSELVARHGREVVRCAVRSRFQGGMVLAAQFEWQDTLGLAVVTLQSGGTLSAWLLPATNRDGSAWRVDDGGDFDPQDIRPYFVVQSGSAVYLGLGWAGAEGMSVILLRAVGDTLTRVYSTRSPME